MVNHYLFISFTIRFLLGDGSVDFDEFLTMMQRRKSTGEYNTELLQVFNVNHYDSNRIGMFHLFE
jgi:Ca2+-binding EF-hand superfamily protein